MSLEQLDRLQLLNACLSCVTSLINPDRDFSAVNRDELALLLGFLTDEQKLTLSAMQ